MTPLTFALPEELPEWQQWLRNHPGSASALWMLKTGQDAGEGGGRGGDTHLLIAALRRKGLRLLPTRKALAALSLDLDLDLYALCRQGPEAAACPQGVSGGRGRGESRG